MIMADFSESLNLFCLFLILFEISFFSDTLEHKKKYAYKIHNRRSLQQDNRVYIRMYHLWYFLHMHSMVYRVKTEKKIK